MNRREIHKETSLFMFPIETERGRERERGRARVKFSLQLRSRRFEQDESCLSSREQIVQFWGISLSRTFSVEKQELREMKGLKGWGRGSDIQ